MELHQLRYVASVARAKNFSRAAEQCHVSQPALSQQIQKLEDELGEKLFERTKREAKLTPQGAAFLPRALRIMEEVDAAKREAREATGLQRGTLTIGVLPTIAPYLLPGVIAAFVKKFPGIEIAVQEDHPANLIKLVLAREVDFALASLPVQDPKLEVQELFTEELLLAVPSGHPLARKRAVTASDLDHERLIVMSESCLGEQVLNFCQRRAAHPAINFRSAHLETIQSLVSTGLGISLIPAMAKDLNGRHRVAYRALQFPKPERKIIAVWLKQRPPGRAATEFLGMAAAWARKAGS
jgi:LysR family hydrogen peroxide-inducible transcriptional activator